MSYYNTPNATINIGSAKLNTGLTVGNYNFPTTVGVDGQFLGVVNGELGFTTAQPGAGVANVVVDGALGDLIVSNLNGNNEIELTMALNPSLSIDQLIISTPDGTPAYSLPVFADGVEPPEGYVIAMGQGGICEFVPSGGGTGSVDQVLGSDNITIGGTLTEPIVELPPNLTDMTSIQFTNSALPTPATTINLDGTTGNILCGGIEINDRSGFSVITSQTTLQIVNTDSAETVTLAILNSEGGASILMDGELGSIQTNLLEINSGIPQSSDGFMGSTSITNDVYIVSTATGGNVPSYSLPQLSTANDVLPNLFPVTGLAVSNNNQLAFQSLDTLFNTGQDVSFVADENNKINTLLNATGTRSNGSFLQASGPDGGDLAWVASLPSGGSITAGDNISVVDAGSGDYTISTVQNPTFTDNVNCTLNLTVEGTLSCLDLTVGDVGFDVPVSMDGGKVLTYDSTNDKMYWGEATGGGVQSVLAGDTNIVVGGTLIDPTVSLNTDISVDSISTLETLGVSFPNGISTIFFTLNNISFAVPELADDGKILSFDNEAQTMTWIPNISEGVLSISGTAGQIELTGPEETPVIGFPATGNVEFPNSIAVSNIPLNVPLPENNGNVLTYNSGLQQMIWLPQSGIQSVVGTANQIAIDNADPENPVIEFSADQVIFNAGIQTTSDGLNNQIIGLNSLSSNIDGTGNIAIGSDVLTSSQHTYQNIAIGYECLKNNNNSNGNVCIGTDGTASHLGFSATVPSGDEGGNCIIGTKVASTLDQGYENVLIGGNICNSWTNDYGNIVMGINSFNTYSSGNYNNVAITQSCNAPMTNSFSNILMGVESGGSLQNANDCIFIGDGAGFGVQNASFSTIMGTNSCNNMTNSNNTISIGYQALENCSDSTDNVVIGNGAGNSLTGVCSNNLILGKLAECSNPTTMSNQIVLGSTAHNTLFVPGIGLDYGVTTPETLTFGHTLDTTALNINGIPLNAPLEGDNGKILSYNNTTTQMEWVINSADGVQSVSQGTNISVGGTVVDPIINLNNNVTLTGTGTFSAQRYTLQSSPNNTHPVGLPWVSDGAYPPAGHIISSDGMGGTQFVANTADGVIAVGGDSNISIGGSPQYPDVQLNPTITITGLNAKNVTVNSTLTTGDLYSYTLPQVTTSTAIPINSLPIISSTPDGNFNQTTSFTTLNNLISASDITATTVSNLTALNINTTNGKVANYVLSVTSNGLNLEWVLNANTSMSTTYYLVNNSGGGVILNMVLFALARGDGSRFIQISPPSRVNDTYAPYITTNTASGGMFLQFWNEVPSTSCLAYISGDNVTGQNFQATYGLPNNGVTFPINPSGTGTVQPIVSMGRAPIVYLGDPVVQELAEVEFYLASNAIGIDFINLQTTGSGSGFVYGEAYLVQATKNVAFQNRGGQAHTFQCTFMNTA